jgi:CheY-like chemotaxis protein
MSEAKTRALEVLKRLPLSRRQREMYERGVAAMDDAALQRTTAKLESALSEAPQVLADARKLLAELRDEAPKRAVIFVENDEYRHGLEVTLGGTLDIKMAGAADEAIRLIGATDPDVIISDFQMPNIQGVDLLRRMRLAAATPVTIFVLTSNPEEDGQVAAAGATGYRTANTAAELGRAVTSAIEASNWILSKD